MTAKSYPQRTEKNVLDSDGNLILSHGKLTGGSKLTVSLAQKHGRPYLHLDFKVISLADATQMLASWLGDNGIRVLNVAGSRASKDPAIYWVTVELLESVMTKHAK